MHNIIPVSVAGGKGRFDNVVEVLSQLDLSIVEGKKILIKPNIGGLQNQGMAITHTRRLLPQ